ncbi:MAG: precorrin-6y C5,15-methyltransferase (decarboxylating) subunit CbiE [Oscillospiraceae bacterium]|nr:precorrin-6y C5,15-methyltransferase (decarboxylating) subunit CbiE [Oscillospiraceae bacterium]
MKRVVIVGTGTGAETLTAQAAAAIERADILLGASRLIEPFSDKPKIAEYAPERVAELIRGSDASSFAVLVSGDPGFYSAANGLCEALSEFEPEIMPGISSLSAFFAKLRRSWQDAALVSCHGRGANLVDTVRRNRLTFALTGGNAAELAKRLADCGFAELTVYVGENLSSERERVFSTTIGELRSELLSSLTVLLIENPDRDAARRHGIPDAEFTRGDVPMTKAEVRSVTLSKLALTPGAVCCDIGAGTGSVTVEMALAAYDGHVYSVEHNPAAVDLIRANLKKFHIGNAEVRRGKAPDALGELPAFDAAFIGGSGGNLREIIAAVLAKNAKTRIVINAVTLRSANVALDALMERGIAPELVQLSSAKASECAGLLIANNPIFIISGQQEM